ncbi:hypothetical protein [Niveispirillum sp.]|uniref:hypothetical protein n=1 Tax=Niveispirillum sp. TaxID=1917217 RepID=UPI001B7B5F5E|nr:hypothetical protein [Niveispirillum sp.]MBP7339966.1 hypothetical protein [Niveispirillum sp.]
MGWMQALMMGMVMGIGAYLFTYLMGRYAESSIQSGHDLKRIEEVLPRRSLLEAKFDLRRSDRKARLTELQAELSELRRRRFLQEKALVDARREANSPVRIIGPEGQTVAKFRAWMVNRQVQQALTDRKRHPTLDMEWANPQVVEIWADNLADAKREAGRIFPMPLGFSLLNITLESAATTTEAAAG